LDTLASVVAMDLVGVRVEVPANTPMVLLREREGRGRLLPIFIGNVEATAIHYALEEIEPPRPLTHDLFASTLENLAVTIERVVITEMREHTYYAELHLRLAGREHVVSSRPSDAIALAVRSGASIHVDDDLLDEVGQEPSPEGDEDAEEIIDEFRDFIENVSPEDFAP
jgi:bifunctional DNase/RNase